MPERPCQARPVPGPGTAAKTTLAPAPVPCFSFQAGRRRVSPREVRRTRFCSLQRPRQAVVFPVFLIPQGRGTAAAGSTFLPAGQAGMVPQLCPAAAAAAVPGPPLRRAPGRCRRAAPCKLRPDAAPWFGMAELLFKRRTKLRAFNRENVNFREL